MSEKGIFMFQIEEVYKLETHTIMNLQIRQRNFIEEKQITITQSYKKLEEISGKNKNLAGCNYIILEDSRNDRLEKAREMIYVRYT